MVVGMFVPKYQVVVLDKIQPLVNAWRLIQDTMQIVWDCSGSSKYLYSICLYFVRVTHRHRSLLGYSLCPGLNRTVLVVDAGSWLRISQGPGKVINEGFGDCHVWSDGVLISAKRRRWKREGWVDVN